MRPLSRRRTLFGSACLACAGLQGLTASAVAQEPQRWSPPAAADRCPSPRWGAADRRGSMNLMTAERAKRAASLIRTGEIV
jgi:hypothetical protein